MRVLFDNGAGGTAPGAPVAGFERAFSRFPVPGTTARSWYLGRGGTLRAGRARPKGADAFTWDPAARPPTSFTGNTGSGPGGLWTATPAYNWAQQPAGHALSYLTAPLGRTTTVVGAGAVQAWIKSSAPDVMLQVTISEVRPDGKETFVQNGWLRTTGRKLDRRRSTLLEPVPSLTQADDRPLPADRFTKVTVPLYYQGHVYRAGSRIRLVIGAPGGDQPVWSFARLTPTGTASVAVDVLPPPPVPPRPPGRPGPRRADAPAALPGAARRGVPALPAAGQRARELGPATSGGDRPRRGRGAAGRRAG